MKNIAPSVIAMALLAVAAILGPSISYADCLVDTRGTYVTDSGWGNTDSSVVQLAASFIPSCTGTVSSFDFVVGRDAPTATYLGFFTIQTDSGGLPSGTVVATSADFSTTGMVPDAPFTVSISASLTSGTTYWLVSDRHAGGTGIFTWDAAGSSGGAIYDPSWSSQGFNYQFDMNVSTGGGGGGSSGTAATSSIEQTQTNLFYAVDIFFASMFFVVWFFKRRV